MLAHLRASLDAQLDLIDHVLYSLSPFCALNISAVGHPVTHGRMRCATWHHQTTEPGRIRYHATWPQVEKRALSVRYSEQSNVFAHVHRVRLFLRSSVFERNNGLGAKEILVGSQVAHGLDIEGFEEQFRIAC